VPDDFDDFLNGDSQPTGGQLRKQLEQVLAERKTLQEQLNRLQSESRTRSISELFSKHSIPELAKDFFPSDAELTDESATSFVEKYGALWGAQAESATTPPAQQAATAAMQRFASEATPPPVAPLSEEQYRSRLSEAKTQTELLKMIDEFNGVFASEGRGEF
jgi:hypothetical protein